MTLAQKLKRLRELLLDPAVRETIEYVLTPTIEERLGDVVRFDDAGKEVEVPAALFFDVFAEAAECAQENAIEAKAEKRMNRT